MFLLGISTPAVMLACLHDSVGVTTSLTDGAPQEVLACSWCLLACSRSSALQVALDHDRRFAFVLDRRLLKLVFDVALRRGRE